MKQPPSCQKLLTEADLPGIERMHERFQTSLQELLQAITAYLQ